MRMVELNEDYQVKLDGIEVDSLVAKAISIELAYIAKSIADITSDGFNELSLPMYSSDPEVELAELKRDREAFSRVLKYYGGCYEI